MPALAQPRPSHRGSPRPAGGSGLAPGLSLAETLVSLVVISILMTSIGSIMVVTGRAVGMSVSHAGESKIDDIVATIAAEQRVAVKVTERTSKSIAFLADRDRDGVAETIRYAWSGVAGDPLTRQVDNGVPTVVVANVKRFNLSYLLKTTAAAAAAAPDVEVSSDVLLYAHDAGSAAAAVSTTGWAAQYFKPNWATVAPGVSVTAWRVTKVEVVASKAFGSTGVTPWIVRLYSAGTDQKPVITDKRDEQTLGVGTMATTASPSALVAAGPFTTNAGLDPAKGMCVTVGPNAFSPNGFVGLDANSTDAAGSYMTSVNSGVTWGAPSTTKDMRIRVWGRYKYPAP